MILNQNLNQVRSQQRQRFIYVKLESHNQIKYTGMYKTVRRLAEEIGLGVSLRECGGATGRRRPASSSGSFPTCGSYVSFKKKNQLKKQLTKL